MIGAHLWHNFFQENESCTLIGCILQKGLKQAHEGGEHWVTPAQAAAKETMIQYDLIQANVLQALNQKLFSQGTYGTNDIHFCKYNYHVVSPIHTQTGCNHMTL